MFAGRLCLYVHVHVSPLSTVHVHVGCLPDVTRSQSHLKSLMKMVDEDEFKLKLQQCLDVTASYKDSTEAKVQTKCIPACTSTKVTIACNHTYCIELS